MVVGHLLVWWVLGLAVLTLLFDGRGKVWWMSSIVMFCRGGSFGRSGVHPSGAGNCRVAAGMQVARVYQRLFLHKLEQGSKWDSELWESLDANVAVCTIAW